MSIAGDALIVDKGSGKVVDNVGDPKRNGPEEVLNAIDTPDQEVPPFPSGAVHSTQPYKQDVVMLRRNALWYSASLGIATIAFTQLLQASALDLPLHVSLFAFAVAIPFLATALCCDWEKSIFPINIDTHAETAMALAGLLAGFIGLASLFFHYNLWVGAIFLVASFGGLITHDVIRKKQIAINSPRQ